MSSRNPFTNRFGLSLLIFILLLNSTPTIAQWDVVMNLQPFPSPYIGDWENNPTIGSLTITNNTSSQADVLIYLTISNNNIGVIATGNSEPITTLPGIPAQINSDKFIDWNTVTYNGSIKDQVIQTGRLPEGEYDACITLKDLNGTILKSNLCVQFNIVYPSPPSLFYPTDGDQLTSNYPVFTWTPVQVPPEYQLRYILKIAEILPGQTSNQALLANTVQYEDDNLLTTNMQYPVSALPLEPGKTYAWQVQAVDQNGFPPSDNEGKSEIWTFVMPGETGHDTTLQAVPLSIEIAPDAAGPFSNFENSSFDTVADRLEPYNSSGGTVALPMSTNTGPSMIFDKIIIAAANRGIYIDRQKKSIAIKGSLTRNGRTYEILFVAAWGSRHDPRNKALILKGPLLSRIFPKVLSGLTEEYLMFSLADFNLKVTDLPDSVKNFFGNENEVELKRGINFLGKFDLHNTPRIADLMKLLRVEQPSVELKGFVSQNVNWVFSSKEKLSRDKTLEMSLSAGIPLTGSLTSWMSEADAELEFSWEHKKTVGADSAENKFTPKLNLQSKLTFPFLRNAARLSDTIGVKGSIAIDIDSEGSHEWVATLETSDILNFPKFENVFKLHAPQIEWNITKGSVKFESDFDFGRYEKAGKIGIEFSKNENSTKQQGSPDTTGLQATTNPTTGSPGSKDSSKVPFGGVPTPFKQAELLTLMNKGSNEPLSHGEKSNESVADSTEKTGKKMEVKVTANFSQSALKAFRLDEVIRTALNLKENLIGDPKDISDFLNKLPALDELSMSFRPQFPGSMVIKGRMTYQNSSTGILISRAESSSKRGFILGLEPQNWSIKNYFPDFSLPGIDNVTLSNVALIFSNIGGIMPSSALTKEELEFYSTAYGKDNFTLVIQPGLNLIASIPSQNLTNNKLVPLMKKLGIQQGNILLEGSLGTKIKDIYLLAEFPAMHPEGSPDWFKSGQMAIELTGLPSIGLAGVLNVKIKDDDVSFIVKTKAGRDGLILSGGMISQEGWDSPFGIQWLTLNKVVLLLGITPSGSVQLGFEGDMNVGEKDIHTAVLVALNAATGVPTNFMLDGKSDAGFGVSDLVKLQHKIAEAHSPGSPAIPLDKFPPLYIKDAKLKFAPKDSPELDISRGMTVGGLLQLKPTSSSSVKDIADVLFDVGDDGLTARAKIDSFSLGPVKLQEANMDLTLTRSEQYFKLTGRSDLGFANADIQMNLTKTQALFNTNTKIFNAFQVDLNAIGKLNLIKPEFNVHGKMKNDFNGILAKELQQVINEVVANKVNEAKAESENAGKQYQSAVNARQAARSRWANTPVLPRNAKKAARNAWESAIAKASKLLVVKKLEDGKLRRWKLASNLVARLSQQTGSNSIISVRRAEFDADLTKLKTGAVKMFDIDATVEDREYNLKINDWNFKDMKASVKSAAQIIADKLFESYQ